MLIQCESKLEAGFFAVFGWIPESSLAVSIPVITDEPSLRMQLHGSYPPAAEEEEDSGLYSDSNLSRRMSHSKGKSTMQG